MNRKLNILFLTNCSPAPIRDGQTRRTFHILKGLATLHNVYLLSLREEKDMVIPEDLALLNSFCRHVEMHPAPRKSVSCEMIGLLLRSLVSMDPYTIWRHYSPSFLQRIRDLMGEVHFDLVHCDTLPIAYTLNEITGCPCVLTDHDVSYLKMARMATQSRNPLLAPFLYLEAAKLKRLESTIFRRISVGIAVSEVDRAILRQLSKGASFEVIENGVDTQAFRPSPTSIESDTLLWLGRFGHYPNREAMHYFLEKTYPAIKKGRPGVRLLLLGGGETDRIRNFAGTDQSIEILGHVPDPVPYLQKVSVVVVPILSGSGTRLKILEAMAAGKAIVSTTIGCEGLDVSHGRDILVADGPEVFADCVVSLLGDIGLMETLGRNARRLAEDRYDWRPIIAKMNAVYSSLASRQGGLR